MTEQQTPTSEVLNRAADLIQERGHATGEGWPGAEGTGSSLCLEGGIMAAIDVTWDNGAGYNALKACPAYRAVRAYLNDPEVNPLRRVPFLWQDALPHGDDGWVGGSEATAREYAKTRVIEVLRAAAAIEQAREADLSGTGECELTAQGVAS